MKLIKLLFVVISLLVLGNVTLTNQSLDQSLEMTKLASEIEVLEKENSIQSSKIATLGALSTLESKIANSGFVAPKEVLAIGESGLAVASR